MSPKRHFIDLTFYETYYFAHLVKNVLEDRLPYIRQLEDFYGNGRHLAYAAPFPRFSALHSFIRFVLDGVLSEDAFDVGLDIRQDHFDRSRSLQFALDYDPLKLPVNLALDRFHIPHQTFESWLSGRGKPFLEARSGEVDEYYDSLQMGGALDELLDCSTAEVFFVLFQNRHALLMFNQMMADQIGRVTEEDMSDPAHGHFFARRGVLHRAGVPSWVKRAIYFRDRGMCVACSADLSGILAIGPEENYDHMVPLAAGGLNDVSNIQLLCRDCNSRKRAGEPMTSSRYEAWYPDRQ